MNPEEVKKKAKQRMSCVQLALKKRIISSGGSYLTKNKQKNHS